MYVRTAAEPADGGADAGVMRGLTPDWGACAGGRGDPPASSAYHLSLNMSCPAPKAEGAHAFLVLTPWPVGITPATCATVSLASATVGRFASTSTTRRFYVVADTFGCAAIAHCLLC